MRVQGEAPLETDALLDVSGAPAAEAHHQY